MLIVTGFSLLGIGLASGFLGATVGSGGIVALPLLIFLGFNAKTAVASLMLSDVVTYVLAMREYSLAGKILWKLAAGISVVVFVGTLLGTQIMIGLDVNRVEDVIGLLILVFLPFVLAAKPNVTGVPSFSRTRVIVCLVLLLMRSVISPIVPAGGGTFMLLVVAPLLRLDLVRAYASLTLPLLTIQVTASVVYLLSGYVDLLLALLLACGAGLGSWLGASSALKRGQTLLRALVIVVALCSATKLMCF